LPETDAAVDAAESEDAGDTAAGAPLVLEGAIFDDPRADIVVSLPPGIPVPTYPIVMNATVEALIDYFTARERERFRLWLARSGRYLGMIQKIFRERGLPEELAYTAMIESGFSPRAISRVGAKGLWQFMEATARRYGLVVNRWVDERFDPVKSTVAAAKYLGDLYGMFGHWFLAQAAYNAGEARVERAIVRAKTSDFWALTQTRHLPNETKRFVPQILAAAVITRAPARYGLEVTMDAPLVYDEVTVKRVVDFESIAALAEVPVEAVRDLNPALRGGITPPFGSYLLRLPPGAGARFEAALHAAHPSRLVVWGLHRIARNQSLVQIARLYRTTPERLAEVNQLRGGRLRGVTELLVPVSNKVVHVTPVPRALSRPPDRAGRPQ
jgi:membrane-bound lytic murein transglycosylase D